MRYLPEWILSTPRLILVILTIGLVVFTNGGISEPATFKDILLLVFGYFFGSRGSEPTTPIPSDSTSNTITTTTSTTTPKEESIIPIEQQETGTAEQQELEFISQKLNEYNNQ